MPDAITGLSARFAVSQQRTMMVQKYHTAPLKIAKVFQFEPNQLAVYVMDSSPGIMAGDHYKLNWHLEEGANVYITNQSFTKLHPSKNNPSTQTLNIWVGKHAVLEYFPEPVMPYKDSDFTSVNDVKLEQGGTIMMAEVLCPGRTFHGEVFEYHSYVNRLKVVYNDELIYYSSQKIKPSEQKMKWLGSWEDQTYLGNLMVFSDLLRPEHIVEIRNILESNQMVYSGVSFTYKHGLLVSMLGSKAAEVQALIKLIWECLRRQLLQLPPLLVRK
ncbi:MAG TPA: urease accessory protein UreD [Bacilli bacterium]